MLAARFMIECQRPDADEIEEIIKTLSYSLEVSSVAYSGRDFIRSLLFLTFSPFEKGYRLSYLLTIYSRG